MTPLEDIAFENLQFIVDKQDFLANRYKIVKQRFVKEEDDDTLYTLQDLEYPLFFTFHQLMNHVHSSYKPTFHGKTKKELLVMFEEAIEVINEYYVETNNSDKGFEVFIDDIEDKVLFIQQYYKYGWCNRAPTLIKDYFNLFCGILLESSRKIVHEYISEVNGLYSYDSDSSESDESDEPLDEDEKINVNADDSDEHTKDD